MIEEKTKSDIVLEEKIAQIDDINFEKIYDVDEFANKQIENLDLEASDKNVDEEGDSLVDEDEIVGKDTNSIFEIEVQPNEFLDHCQFRAKENDDISQRFSSNISFKPLVCTFASIAVLLCILLIYNVFVINSLSATLSSKQVNASFEVAQVVKENKYISFENSSQLEIENFDRKEFSYSNQTNSNDFSQTSNWFDSLCDGVDSLFGG